MSTTQADRAGHRLSIVDEDPLRARREARELLARLKEVDPRAALHVPSPEPGSRVPGPHVPGPSSAAQAQARPHADATVPVTAPATATATATEKGGLATDVVGLVFSGGSLAASAIQIWLARVPQRTISVTRPDGTTIRISGKQARADDAYIERFLAGGRPERTQEGPGEA